MAKKDFEMRPCRTCTVVIQVSVGEQIRGEPGAARAFCGIDYSLLSRCTSRVKSAPLSVPTSTPSTLFHLLFPTPTNESLFPRSASTLYLISALFFLFSTPLLRFASRSPQPRLSVTPCWHISFSAHRFTCEQSC